MGRQQGEECTAANRTRNVVDFALYRQSKTPKTETAEAHVVRDLELLLKQAKRGYVSGLAWVAIVPSRGGFFADTAGVLTSNTGRAREVLREFESDLATRQFKSAMASIGSVSPK